MKRTLLFTLLFISVLRSFSQNTCPPNIGFSAGDFTNWQCHTGNTAASNCSTNTVTVTPSTPIGNRHTIIAATTQLDPFGLFPITPDNNSIARLGFAGQVGAQVERISYTFTIPSTATQYSLAFKFAVVYQDPSHCQAQQPHFEAKVYNVTTSQYISCVSAEYYATPGTNGFQLSTNTNQGTVYYKPWTTVTMLLSKYIGHTLRLEFTNADCTAGGHWAYAYLDLPQGCDAPATGNEFCPASSTTVMGPYGYQSYTWWNSNFTQNLGTTQSLTLTPPPTVPTVYAVDLISPAGAGCRDTAFITVKPKVTSVSANAGPDGILCGGSTGITLGTAAVAGYTYSWTPSTGLSNASAAQPVAQPLVTTTYVLTVTDTVAGCSKTDTTSVFVNAVPSAFAVNSTNQCLNGNLFQFTMGSTLPGSSYIWDFGDGSTSVTQNPSHVYPSIGTYMVKVKVTSSTGCKDSSAQSITVVGTPATPTISLSGNVLSSSAASGNQWYLNGVAIAGATAQTYTAPTAGVYTVKITLSNCSSPSSNAITYSITGIDAIAAEWKLHIGPNPISDQLLITHNGYNKLDLEILDLMGRRLFARTNIGSTYTVDLSSFTKGNYLVRLTNSKTQKEVRKLVVKM